MRFWLFPPVGSLQRSPLQPSPGPLAGFEKEEKSWREEGEGWERGSGERKGLEGESLK